jgi:hypothetical protein
MYDLQDVCLLENASLFDVRGRSIDGGDQDSVASHEVRDSLAKASPRPD